MSITAVTSDAAGRVISWIEGEYTFKVSRDTAGRPLYVRATSPSRKQYVAEFKYTGPGGAFSGVTGDLQSSMLGTLIRDASSSGNVPVFTRDGSLFDIAGNTIAIGGGGGGGYPPVNTAAPVSSGTPNVGQILSATTGTWSNSPTSFTYQWYRSGTAIVGATSSTYSVVSADIGASLTVNVTATNSYGFVSSVSNSLSVPNVPSNTVAPSVSGSATVGGLLTASPGTWTDNPTGYTYKWQRAGVDIPGATSSTYTAISADAGAAIRVVVTATNTSGSASANSAVTNVAVPIPSSTAAPTISGSVASGSALTVSNGTWLYASTYTYQWYRGNLPISGATANSYTLVADDIGMPIKATVTATNAAGSASSSASPVTASYSLSNSAATSGNFFTNVPSAGNPTVTTFTVSGVAGTFTAGQAATAPSYGTVQINANGTWTITPANGVATGAFPGITVNYTYSGTAYSSAFSSTVSAGTPLSIALSGNWPPAPFSALPTTAISTTPLDATGTGTRYDVGPGKNYTDLNSVPWLSLTPGSVVNIFYQPTPYKTKFALCCVGTAANPIIINGVTDSSGNRPIISGDGATTAADAVSAGFLSYYGVETAGVVVIYKAIGTDNTPAYITFQNLVLRDGHPSKNFYNTAGTLTAYQAFSCGIYAIRVDHLTVQYCDLTGNGLSVFTNSRGNLTTDFSSYVTIRGCKIYGNGVVGADTIHNLYTQGIRTLIEGNYIDRLISGATGSTVKDRSSGTVIRYNKILTNARALDLVESEETGLQVKADPLYPDAWVYGNLFINDDTASSYSAHPLHWGYDNGASSARTGTLYFYNNTFMQSINPLGYCYLFQVNLGASPVPKIDLRSNVFHHPGASNSLLYFLQDSGALTFNDTNWVHSDFNTVMRPGDTGTITTTGTLARGTDPGLKITYEPSSTSALIDLAQSFPTSYSASNLVQVSNLQVDHQYTTSSAVPSYAIRATNGVRMDLGAFEFVPIPPQNVGMPTITGTPVAGKTQTVSTGTWTDTPTSYSYQWYMGSTPVGTNSNTYVPSGGGSLTCAVTATNTIGSTTVTTAAVSIAASATLPVNTVAPVISGTARVGFTLTATQGTWSNYPDTVTLQWAANGVDISGQTATTYIVQAGDIGKTITVRSIATNGAGTASASSNGLVASAAAYGNGVTFDFTGLSDGTLLSTVSQKWTNGNQMSVYSQMLRTEAAYTNGTSVIRYVDGQGSNQAIAMTRKAGAIAAYMRLLLQNTDAVEGYRIVIASYGCDFYKNGTYVTSCNPIPTNVDANLVFKVNAGVVTFIANGTTLISWTDSSPVTGGYPAFVVNDNGVRGTHILDNITDSPSYP